MSNKHRVERAKRLRRQKLMRQKQGNHIQMEQRQEQEMDDALLSTQLQAAQENNSPLAATQGRQLQRRQVMALQRRAGNSQTAALIQRYIGDGDTAQIQRHPPNAPLLEGVEEGAQQAPQANNETDAGGAAQPTALGNGILAPAMAQDAIKKSFGGIAESEIVQGDINIAQNQQELYRQYDLACVRDGVTNPDTGVTWVMGDLARSNQRRNLRTNAFADGDTIWIDATQTDPTATVHEMLHVNTDDEFRSTAGEVINEGMTQRLAVKAVSAAGFSTVGSENTYQKEQDIVDKLVNILGEAVMQNAYFNNPDMMVDAYRELMGEGILTSFDIIKRVLSLDPPGYDYAKLVLQPRSLQQKLDAINGLLDWWVDDDDITIIESIVSTASESEKRAIARAIRPRISELLSIGQRVRLWILLGVGDD